MIHAELSFIFVNNLCLYGLSVSRVVSDSCVCTFCVIRVKTSFMFVTVLCLDGLLISRVVTGSCVL